MGCAFFSGSLIATLLLRGAFPQLETTVVQQNPSTQNAHQAAEVPDKFASFPTEWGGLQQFIRQRVNWNLLPSRSGHMYAAFTVDATGRIQKLRLVRGLEPAHDHEIMRILRQMPTWTPAQRHGKPCAQEWVIPILFAPSQHVSLDIGHYIYQ